MNMKRKPVLCVHQLVLANQILELYLYYFPNRLFPIQQGISINYLVPLNKVPTHLGQLQMAITNYRVARVVVGIFHFWAFYILHFCHKTL